MTLLFDTGIFSVEETDGAVGVGWKLAFYDGGTSTPRNTYPTFTDANAGTNPNTNPVLSDASGRFPAMWMPDDDYKVVLRDDVDVVKVTRELEGMSLSSQLQAPSGAGLVGFSFDENYDDGTAGKAIYGVRNIMAAPYDAAMDGVTNDGAAFQAAVGDGVAVIPDMTMLSNTAVTGEFRAIALGTTFTGTNPPDAQYPAFGPGVLKVIARGTYYNSIIGIAHNTAPAATLTFPTGVTAYGRMDNGGNVCFGLYAEARTYATTGCPTNEIDCFNHGGAPSGALPPDRSIGTAQQVPVGLTVGADGDFNSSIGIHVCQGGISPKKWLTGIYIGHDSCVNYGLFIDAQSTSTYIGAVIKHSVAQVGLQVQGVGTPVAGNAAFVYYDGAAVERFSVRQNGGVFIGGIQVLSGRQTGWTAATGSATRTTFATGSVTLPQLAERVKALLDDLLTNGIIGA